MVKIVLNIETYDFGFTVEKNKFHYEDNYGISPCPTVISYALLVCASGKSSNIYLTGIDGYNNGDSRNFELELLFDLYFKNKSVPKICSITNTKFNLPIISVYNLI